MLTLLQYFEEFTHVCELIITGFALNLFYTYYNGKQEVANLQQWFSTWGSSKSEFSYSVHCVPQKRFKYKVPTAS